MPEPFTQFYDHINRNAIVVSPLQPFLNWINGLSPESPVLEIEEGTIYLIASKADPEEVEKWLKKNFDKIFQNELNDWHEDESDWPAKRTYDQFTKWFKIEIVTMILDIEDSPIRKT